MNKFKKHGNGGVRTAEVLKGKEIDFPVTYQLKAVMTGTENDDDNKEKLTTIFAELDIVYKYHDKKVSSKGAYVSFTYIITVTDKVQMDNLYSQLKLIKELKFAV
jgi:putative lipoic acid-binding regulatory protein